MIAQQQEEIFRREEIVRQKSGGIVEITPPTGGVRILPPSPVTVRRMAEVDEVQERAQYSSEQNFRKVEKSFSKQHQVVVESSREVQIDAKQIQKEQQEIVLKQQQEEYFRKQQEEFLRQQQEQFLNDQKEQFLREQRALQRQHEENLLIRESECEDEEEITYISQTKQESKLSMASVQQVSA